MHCTPFWCDYSCCCCCDSDKTKSTPDQQHLSIKTNKKRFPNIFGCDITIILIVYADIIMEHYYLANSSGIVLTVRNMYDIIFTFTIFIKSQPH